METRGRQIDVQINGCARSCLIAVVVLLAAMVAGNHLTGLRTPQQAEASAALPSAAEQRERMIRLQQETNHKLDRLLILLESGTLTFQTRPAAPFVAPRPLHDPQMEVIHVEPQANP